MAGHYLYLIEQLMEDPSLPCNRLRLLKPEQENDLVYNWNNQKMELPRNLSAHQVFQNQADKTPDRIAVVYEGIQMTFRELNEKSNQLARHIRIIYSLACNKPVTPGTIIALFLERSLEMVVAILGVLKAGAAYLPVDIKNPRERIEYLLHDSNAELTLCQRRLNFPDDLGLPRNRIVNIDLSETLYYEGETTNLPVFNSDADLAYIIYTSGTTGKPKGVMVEHRQIVSFASAQNYIDYEKISVVACISNYAFDGSIFDLFATLLNGKQSLILNNEQLLDLAALDAHLTKFAVDTVFITTSLFNALVIEGAQCFDYLNQVLIGGEACNRHIVNEFKKRYPAATLINAYGPTENIVFSTFCRLNDVNTNDIVPIGRPLSDKYIYVLDKYQIPVPVGIPGELYIGGTGVARGYLNRPDLNSASFLTNPFVGPMDKANNCARMYKTGDIVRWLPDGNLEFIGRKDDQVKIRGHRIELGEIEQALSAIYGIKHSYVTIKVRKTFSGDSKYIVGYYVPEQNIAEPARSIILQELAKSLPEYMLPETLIKLDSFPLTINGKLDKLALPDPVNLEMNDEYVAPVNQLEMIACTIWQEVLGVERVGLTDNFFRIGGNSIMAIHLAHKMSHDLKFEVKVADILKSKDISMLLEIITGNTVTCDNIEWDI